MIVRITAKRDGFRRCGIAHPAQPVEHPAERFSAAELARLQGEPMLLVELLADPLTPAVDADAAQGDLTQAAEAPAAAAPALGPEAPIARPNAKAGARAPAKAGK